MGRTKIYTDHAARQAAYRARCQEREARHTRQGDYSTPQDLFETLNQIYHFTLDVCATAANAKCPRYFTPEQDGLAQPWHGTCWMNPPYHQSELPRWIRKAYEEAQRGAHVVALLPARTGSAWFHDLVLPHAEVTFLRGRVKLAGLTTNAREDSMLAVLRPPCAPPGGNGHGAPVPPPPHQDAGGTVSDPDNSATLEALEQEIRAISQLPTGPTRPAAVD